MKERGGNGLTYSLYASDGTSSPSVGYVHVGTADVAAVGDSLLPLNAWSHLAATFNGTALKLYVNGDLIRTTNISGNIATSADVLQIGGNTVFTDEYFKGLIDDVRIYNRVLTQSEIFTDMSTPVGGGIDSTAPVVSISSPASGACVSGTLSIASNATDDTGISRSTSSSMAQRWTGRYAAVLAWNSTTYSNGSYTLSAVARDFAGNQATSANVTVTSAITTTRRAVSEPRAPNGGAMVSGTVPCRPSPSTTSAWSASSSRPTTFRLASIPRRPMRSTGTRRRLRMETTTSSRSPRTPPTTQRLRARSR